MKTRARATRVRRYARVEAPIWAVCRAVSKQARAATRRGKGGVVVSEPCFSASQIEKLFGMPQKWFALRPPSS